MTKESKHRMEAEAGAVVTISLPSNPTTGFSWQVEFTDPALTYRELPYRARGGGLGAGGTQRFEVTPARPGNFVMRLELRRPWDREAKEVRTYHIDAGGKE